MNDHPLSGIDGNEVGSRQKLLDLLFEQTLTGIFFMMLDEPIRWNDDADKDALLDYVFAHQRITRINRAMLEQYRATPEDFLGSTPNKLFGFDLAQGRAVWRQFFDAGRLHVDTDERRMDGSPMSVLGDYICLYDDKGRITGHFGMQIDVTDRREAERIIAKNEERFNLAMDGANAGLWDWDLLNETIYYSPAWKKILGFEPDELPNRMESWTERWHPDDAPRIWKAMDECLFGNNRHYESTFRMRHRDGTWRWILSRGTVILDPDGKPVRWIGTHSDVTDLVQERERNLTMQVEKDLIGATIAATAEAIVVVDAAGRILLANPAAERIMDLSSDQSVGLRLADQFTLVDGRTGEQIPDPVQTVLDTQKRVEFPTLLRLVRRDGSVILVTGSLAPIQRAERVRAAVVATFRDVSHEFMLEQEIEGFLNVNLDMLCVRDDAGAYVKVNRKFEQVLGYPAEEIKGRSFMEFVHPEDVGIARDALAGVGSGDALSGFVIRYRRCDGTYRHIEWNSIPGVEHFLYASARDVTEQVVRAERLRALATRDELTGLYNRHQMDVMAASAMELSDRHGEPLSMILFDLDHFKRVNDTFGHLVGDEVLRATAGAAGHLLRETDALFRIGGEEFLVLLPSTALAGAAIAAEKIRASIDATSMPVVGRQTVSAGVSERMKSESFRHWLRRTDDAMYRAKLNGRNRVIPSDGTEKLSADSLRIDWRSEWGSGNATIDAQHRELFVVGNELVAASLSNDMETAVRKVDSLLEHLASHFVCEERILEDSGWSEAREHARIHQELLVRAGRLRQALDRGEVKPSSFFSFIVDDVVMGHLTVEDVKYFPRLAECATSQ